MSAPQTAERRPGPWAISEVRLGTSPVERKALGKLQRELAAMPASLIVQIALWPVKLADWARERKISPAMVYNCLAGTKPYEPVRDMLAESLGVTRFAIERLIDCRPTPPLALVPPDPDPESLPPPDETSVAAATRRPEALRRSPKAVAWGGSDQIQLEI